MRRKRSKRVGARAPKPPVAAAVEKRAPKSSPEAAAEKERQLNEEETKFDADVVPHRDRRPFPIVGIGASAGGLEAFTLLLQHLPSDTGMGLVLVQHLDPSHPSALTELLTRTTRLPVEEVKNNTVVERNHVYVIPPNMDMSIHNGVLRLETRRPSSGQHRSIDFFFRSLALDQGTTAIGVILSGTATDGTLGLEAIKAEGGITFAQDERSARYDSMPRTAIASGCVDFVLPPQEIAKEVGRFSRHSYF